MPNSNDARVAVVLCLISWPFGCGGGNLDPPGRDGGDAGSEPDAASEERGAGDEPRSTDACGDGLDDDGDGLVDENCPCVEGETQPCYGGAAGHAGTGACLLGEQVCEGVDEFLSWGECARWIAPSAEVCGDGIDQDCDGLDSSCTEGCGDTRCEGSETCRTCRADCGDCPPDPAPCGDSPSGTVETRTRYESESVPAGESCTSETQTRTCVDGEWTEWTGSYAHPECTAEPDPECTDEGVSPQLAAQPAGPFQNCAGAIDYPSTWIQSGTVAWSGCCGFLVRECVAPGLSVENRLYCEVGADAWCHPDPHGLCQR